MTYLSTRTRLLIRIFLFALLCTQSPTVHAEDTQLPLYDDGGKARWPDDKFVRHSVPDPEGWMYEHAVKDGKPAFPYTHQMVGQHPVQAFIKRKLGCMFSMSNYNRTLDHSVTEAIFGAGRSSRMALIDGQYLVGHACIWRNCTTKGLMILDIKNRWSAFAYKSSQDMWSTRNEDIAFSRYWGDAISLFLVDDSPIIFNVKAMELTERWKREWSWVYSSIDPNIPIKSYAFQCDQP